MLLFLKIFFSMFIAEMGDKTQLLLVAMASKIKLRDIIIGSFVAELVLNGLAVGLGSVINRFVPLYVIKIAAGLAFFFFAYSTLRGGEDEEESAKGGAKYPVLTVFGTFFLAELGDKTQLTTITFAADNGAKHALTVWLACCAGLFLADMIGVLVGYLLKSKMPAGLMNTLAFGIFAVFGVPRVFKST